MDRTAIFVDAGYLFAAGSRLLTNERSSRGDLQLNYDVLLRLFANLTQELTGLPLLRIYWYDATAGGPTSQQLALAYLPNLKLRLGSLNQQGQQKGVDSLLILDMINLARNRAIADALLMTGDEDVRVGVQQAQEFGVRVHLIGVAPARENQSGTLVQDADTLRELSEPEVRSFLAVAPSSSVSDGSNAGLSQIAKRVADDLGREELEAVLQESPGGSLPAHIDRRLLVAGSSSLGGTPLSSDQKRQLRAAFIAYCRAL